MKSGRIINLTPREQKKIYFTHKYDARKCQVNHFYTFDIFTSDPIDMMYFISFCAIYNPVREEKKIFSPSYLLIFLPLLSDFFFSIYFHDKIILHH
jgi:hypothetical protein